MNKNISELSKARDETYKSIRKYLILSGWIELDLFSLCGGHVKDPITGLVHSIDYAYIVQCDRDLIKSINK